MITQDCGRGRKRAEAKRKRNIESIQIIGELTLLGSAGFASYYVLHMFLWLI